MAKTIAIFRKYGYGIVDRNGEPWWDEGCVCQDRGPLTEIVRNLNENPEGDEHRVPYRVVELRFRSGRKAQEGEA